MIWAYYQDPGLQAVFNDPVPPHRLAQYAHLLKALPTTIDLSKSQPSAVEGYLRMVGRFVVYQTPTELQVWTDHGFTFPE